MEYTDSLFKSSWWGALSGGSVGLTVKNVKNIIDYCSEELCLGSFYDNGGIPLDYAFYTLLSLGMSAYFGYESIRHYKEHKKKVEDAERRL